MGACLGKGGAASQDNKIERDRRRLSISKVFQKAEKARDNNHEVNTHVTPAGEGNVLDLFPQADHRLSLCGVANDAHQKGFTEKNTAKCGDEALNTLKIGCVCKKGLKPESPNQDDFCIFHADGVSIYGVFDGHGPYGHDISSFVQENLPRNFVQDPNFQENPEKALAAAFPETHRLCSEYQTEGHFDCALSGTTATLAMLRSGILYIAYVGDSRVVLARKQGNEFKAEDLTTDHKPTCEGERRRITAAGGQVRRLEGDIPHRVFLNGKMYPGLAMTRSIGDTVGTTAGVTSVPDVSARKVLKDWRFVLICSDGIWEFISTQEAVDIVAKHAPSDVQRATESLALEAWNRWVAEEVNVVDDITVICAWFNED